MNGNLHRARNNRKDDFYTLYADIEEELRHYGRHFKGKTVYCNCDDLFVSDFVRYFLVNFNALGLKRLIVSGFPVAGGKACMAFIDSVPDGGCCIDRLLSLKENCAIELSDDGACPAGDFRSFEAEQVLDGTDIVVTNPPFSLFGEFVDRMVSAKKRFVVWGSGNALSYRGIFTLLQEGKLSVGYTANATKIFRIPSDYGEYDRRVTEMVGDGNRYCRVPSITVYTDLDIEKRHRPLGLVKRYDPSLYPKYENFDAINVDKVSDIPCDYRGMMGVPISFLNSYNPEQFEIIGLGYGELAKRIGMGKIGRGFLDLYFKQGNKGNYVPNHVLCCYVDNKGRAKIPYARVIIRRK